jgi:hypothetical protein
MAPKKKSDARASSPSPKPKAGAKAKGKAEAKEDPKAKLEREAVEMFERYEPDGKLEGVLKLKEFADIIRAVNSKKCMIWGDDPAAIIRKEWANTGGNVSRELKLEEFKAWWPAFSEAVDKEAADKLEAAAAAESAKAKEKEEKYGHDGVWKCNLKEIKEAMDEAKKKGKTPLIIDNTTGFSAEAFFAYGNAYILETKKWIVEKAKGSTVEEIFEAERNRFFTGGKCFEHGSTVMFRLANSAPDLKKVFSTELFPTLALLDQAQVANITGIDNAKNVATSPFAKMPPNADERIGFEAMGVKEGFQVVVVTQFAEADYEEFLKEMIPLDLMQPIMPTTD